jgi:outer membrane protein OmpA-like peptidoglycan-associated protein
MKLTVHNSMAVSAIILSACAAPLHRSAAPCPLRPSAPPCAAVEATNPPLFAQPWRAVTVQHLDVAGREEFPVHGGTIVGSSFTDASIDAPIEFITLIRPGSVIGDADIARVVRKGAVADTLVEAISVPVMWDGHPTLWNSWMIFASDRPGSLGGTDLWYCKRQSSGWTSPRPLAGANTPCDELSPFVRLSDGTLWWSTSGGATLGGYDVVYAPLLQDGDSLLAGPTQNPGSPVNTAADELFPVYADSLRFASNRRDRTDFDVYVMQRQGSPVLPTTPPATARRTHEQDSAKLTGVVVDGESKLPVADAEVTARDERSRQVIASTRTDTSGTWTLTVPVEQPVDVSAQSGALFLDRRTITIPRIQRNSTVSLPEPLALPATFVLRVNFPTGIFDAPYERTLDSNGWETMQGWQDALDDVARNVVLGGTKLRRLVLIGHTDDIGTDASNNKLGRQRVEFIIDELVRRGVQRSILEGRSAGEQLLPSRRTGETEESWRKRARRVELVKVLQQ